LDFAAAGDAGRGVEFEPAVFVLGGWVAEGQQGAEGMGVRGPFVDAGAGGGAGVGEGGPAVVVVVNTHGVGLDFAGGSDDERDLMSG
jgi:hypothetical protein